MAYQVKITNEDALKKAHPELFKIDQRWLKRILVAAKTLGQNIPGAELVEIPSVDAPQENDTESKGE